MRTLTRPMFNMGGPIKQGIMTGIREPYAGGGQAAGRAALVGNPVYPKTGGREHHVIPFLGLGAAAMRVLPAAYRGYKAAKYFKPGTLGKWGRFKSMFGVGRGLGAPMAEPGAGLGFRIGSFAKQNPFTTFGIASTVPQAGYGAYKVAKAAPETAWGATKRWADYVVPGDQSRWWKDKEPPTAVPLNQATSKRLDKPDQIREAVGLMATKAEIEKDLEDPSIKALRLEQLKELRGGFAKDIGDFILSAKGTKVKPKALERVARARAQEHGLDFKVVTDADIAGAGADADLETIIQSAVKDDGVYMIGDALIQVIDGVPKQIS
jgi:hypothetical protein